MCKAQLKPGILAIRTKKEASNCAELMVHSVDSDFTLDFSSVDVGCVSEREIAIDEKVTESVWMVNHENSSGNSLEKLKHADFLLNMLILWATGYDNLVEKMAMVNDCSFEWKA